MMRKQIVDVGAWVRRGLGVLGVAAALCLAAGCPVEDPEEQVVTYTVTYDANGGTGSVPAAQTVNAGAAITLPGQGSDGAVWKNLRRVEHRLERQRHGARRGGQVHGDR